MQYVKEVSPGMIYNNVFRIQPNKIEHQRKIYGFLSFIGDLGGVKDIIMLMFGFFVLPFSEFSFNLKAMKKLFLVRSNDHQMFKACHDEDHALKMEFKVTNE